MNTTVQTIITNSRAFGLGLAPDQAQNLMGSSPTQEIQPNLVDLLTASVLKSGADLLTELYEYREQKKKNEVNGKPQDNDALTKPNQTYQAELAHRFDKVWTQPNTIMPLGIYERLVMFWTNHFAVSVRKGQPLLILAGAFEREAIRPHIYGRFEDMLTAVISHPAMLIYLDNDKSIGPNSQAARRATRSKSNQKNKGLNENLARELLELHTLGAQGGYSQDDVLATAKLLTGWTAMGPRLRTDHSTGFVFRPETHEPGPQIVMGRQYSGQTQQEGQEKLIDLLKDLSLNPTTAHHICKKLIEHFITDSPRPSDIETLAKIYQNSGGDLYKISLHLMNDPQLRAQLGQKIRSPQEHLIAVARAVPNALNNRQFMRALKEIGQPLWEPPGPDGYSSQRSIWVSAEGMNSRLQVCHSLSRRPMVTVDARSLSERVFASALSDDTRMSIHGAETRNQGLSLFMMSPEMMKR
jgi:uncharacterized protein (DUF1800 family)